MEEEKIGGTGAIKDTPDIRDFQYADVGMSLPPFDWEKGYDVEDVIGRKLKVKDQNGSGSCGGQAWSYYGEVLDPDNEEKSAKFIYAHTFVKPAGSAGRTNCNLVIDKGWGDEDKTPSYDNGLPPEEEFMQRKSDITKEAFIDALLDKGLSYANVYSNVDSIAQAIANNKGCIIGITGKNNGTWTTKFPLPPTIVDNSCWNHWVYVGKAKMIDGKKYIGFINSWGERVGENGWQWITEDYIKSNLVWSVWTMVYNFPKPVNLYKFTITMRQGSRGSEVKELQKRVNALPLDGVFGPITKKAVQDWQIKHNLVGDGIVGPLTRAELNK